MPSPTAHRLTAWVLAVGGPPRPRRRFWRPRRSSTFGRFECSDRRATALTGIAEWRRLFDRSTRRVAVVHATGNIAVIAFYVLSWLRLRQGRHVSGTAWGKAGGILALFTGYLGGHLSFGRGVGHGERWPITRTDRA